MNLQHINIKIYTEKMEANPADFNPAFQTWIQKKLTEELLIDVADYLHVPAGPGMVLIGHEADYSMDQTDHRWGLRYNRKAPLDGTPQDRFAQALRACLQGSEKRRTVTGLGLSFSSKI